MSTAALKADHPAIASQATFRAVMDAIARPGEIRPLATSIAPPAPLTPTAAAIAVALIDFETPVWLDAPLAASREVASWLKFETGAPLVRDPRRAAFALIADPAGLPPFESFALGSEDFPDRSTTLVIQVDGFDNGDALTLWGPGIAQPRRFSAAPLPAGFAELLAANRALFPRGLDFVLAGPDAVAALPRSVQVDLGGD